jgi:hypothetical protein
MNQNYINHIALVLDASQSMEYHAKQVVDVADAQIQYLAQRSKELDQETRVTVYMFNDKVQCLIYDKDVLRLPSLRGLYRTGGMTALIDATIQSQKDLAATAQLYGDHAFLTYILTDGQENRSRQKPDALRSLLSQQADNWTVAVLVPDAQGEFEAKSFGFSKNNIAIWDTRSDRGVRESFDTIRTATDRFMQGRASGIRGTKGLFDMSSNTLNKSSVTNVLNELPSNKYKLLHIDVNGAEIRPFVESHKLPYYKGVAFYELTKAETIQPQKQVCVLDNKTSKVYSGQHARDLIGLPNYDIRVRPQDNPQYSVFVQSTSVNRKLVKDTLLLVMT